MQITLTAEQVAHLQQLAATEGKAAEDLARELFSRSLADEDHFLSAVQAGIAAADRGDFVEPSEVWSEVEKALQS
jgi:predicted transcriptional regulator